MRKNSIFSFVLIIFFTLVSFWAIPSQIEIGDSNSQSLPDLSAASNSPFYSVDANGTTVEKLHVSLNFELGSLPDEYATIFNSDTEHNNGISFVVDRLGDLYMSIGSIEQRPGASQQLLLMKMIQPGIGASIEATYDYSSKQLSVIFNGISLGLISSDPTRPFLFDDCLVRVGAVRLWGIASHQFEGKINGFSMSFSRNVSTLSTINLRLFVLMAGIFSAIWAAKKVKSPL